MTDFGDLLLSVAGMADDKVSESVADEAEKVIAASSSVSELTYSIDTIWVLLAAMLVFWMQPGFALVEAGFTRAKNTTNILMKNFIDFAIGSLFFWFVGFGIMFGENNGFWGCIDFFGTAGWHGGIPTSAFLIFQTMFCATAATIVSGAVAERTEFKSYLLYSVFISVLIYPIVGHWIWGGGWLSELGFHDFAGSTVVHSVGGWLALCGAIVLGPRLGKYSKEGKSRAIPGHNLSLASLGVFILWLGWFGFNPGSQLAASGIANATAISHIFLTTNLAAAAGGVTAIAFVWMRYKKPSLSLALNGILAGLVGVTAGCDVVSPGGAVIIGALCSIIMVISVEKFDKVFRIDDPVGAISVHGVCGIIGTIFTGLFSIEGGLFYGGGFHMLLIQLLGIVAVGAWTFGSGMILFLTIKKLVGFRVDKRVEEEGLDIYEHGESAYN